LSGCRGSESCSLARGGGKSGISQWLGNHISPRNEGAANGRTWFDASASMHNWLAKCRTASMEKRSIKRAADEPTFLSTLLEIANNTAKSRVAANEKVRRRTHPGPAHCERIRDRTSRTKPARAGPARSNPASFLRDGRSCTFQTSLLSNSGLPFHQPGFQSLQLKEEKDVQDVQVRERVQRRIKDSERIRAVLEAALERVTCGGGRSRRTRSRFMACTSLRSCPCCGRTVR
jgi:hypothetical protein